jgi:hypothetical protein
MVIRQVQVLLVGLVAVSALQHSAFQATQMEARLQAERLAKINRSTAKVPGIKASEVKAPGIKATTAKAQSSRPKKQAERSKPAEIPIQ